MKHVVIESCGGSHQVTIRVRRATGARVVLGLVGIMLAFWGMPVSVVNQAWFAVFPLLFMLVLTVWLLLWQLRGRECILLSDRSLNVSYSVRGLPLTMWPRVFARSRIRNVRLETEQRSAFVSPGLIAAVGGARRIAFDYDGQVEFVGRGLSDRDAEAIAELMDRWR